MSWKKRMDEYKGGPLPPFTSPLIGLAAAYALPRAFLAIEWPQAVQALCDGAVTPADRLAAVVGVAGVPVALLFIAEFIFGAHARSKSNKAALSPAGAQAAGIVPFELIEANRIHQNHIENFLMVGPAIAAMIVTNKDVRFACALSLSWVVARIMYRIGYRHKENPLWRTCGTTTSHALALTAIFFTAKALF